MQYDVIVIGGGPSGSTAAHLLAKEGHNVIIIDKDPFPREKICGDGIIPDTINCLKKLDLYNTVKNKAFQTQTLTYYSHSLQQVDFNCEILTMKRKEFDNILITSAIKHGAKLEQNKVIDITEDKTSVTLHLNDGTTKTAAIVLMATGANVSLLKKHNLLERQKASAVAIRGYVKSDINLTKILFKPLNQTKSIKRGYGWIFPLTNNEYNIGVGVFYTNRSKHPDLKKLLQTFINEFPPAKELLENGTFTEEPKAAMLRTGLKGAKFSSDRVLAIGESIGTTFPLTGEGIGKAMESGIIAAQIVDKALKTSNLSLLQTYSTSIQKHMGKIFKGYEIGEKWVNKAWFSNLMVSKAKKSSYLRQKFSDVLNEKLDLEKSLTLKNILKIALNKKG